MLSLILHLCAATRASSLARNAAAAAGLSSDAAAVQRGTPGYEALLEKNWVGNVQFNSAETVVPASLEELCEVVKNADAVRVLGRGHVQRKVGLQAGAGSETRAAQCLQAGASYALWGAWV